MKYSKVTKKAVKDFLVLHTGFISATNVVVGSLLAFYLTGNFDIIMFVSMLVASILIHFATNAYNEYYDVVNGLDKKDNVLVENSGSILHHNINPKVVLYTAHGLVAAAMLIGGFITLYCNAYWIAILGFLGICTGFLYSGGPRPLAGLPVGEILSGGWMGPIVILISFFVNAKTFDITEYHLIVNIGLILLAGLPFGLPISIINGVNHLCDVPKDEPAGRKTFPIVFGIKASRILNQTMLVGTFVVVIINIILKLYPVTALLAFYGVLDAKALFNELSKDRAYTPELKPQLQMMDIFVFNKVARGMMIGLVIGIIIKLYA